MDYKIKCEYCGSMCDPDATKCALCGASIKGGKKVYKNATPTNTYNEPTHTKQSSHKMIYPGYKSKYVAAFLAILFGYMGLQKFYMRKYIQGILCFLFSWTAIPTIIGFIEGIQFILCSEEDFIKKLN